MNSSKHSHKQPSGYFVVTFMLLDGMLPTPTWTLTQYCADKGVGGGWWWRLLPSKAGQPVVSV